MKNFIGIFAIILMVASCEKSTTTNKVSIKDFSKKYTDSLIPDPKNQNYFNYKLDVKGNSNDSIKISISLSNKENSPAVKNFYFIGDFDETILEDYYGDTNIYITFDPYKATKGKLELAYSL